MVQHRANEEEGAMQSRYSTFKEEGQYVAGGLKGIHEKFKADVSTIRSMMNETIKTNDRVESMTIADLSFDDGRNEKIFVFPALGGEKIDDLVLVNPSAPLGRALLRKEVGDTFSYKVGDKTRKGEVTNVK